MQLPIFLLFWAVLWSTNAGQVFEVHHTGQVKKKNRSVVLSGCKYDFSFHTEYCQFLPITFTTAISKILLYMFMHKILHRNRRRTALNSVFCAFNMIFQCIRMRCGNIAPVMLEGRSQNLVVLSNNFHADLLYSEINLFVEQMRLAIHSLYTPWLIIARLLTFPSLILAWLPSNPRIWWRVIFNSFFLHLH